MPFLNSLGAVAILAGLALVVIDDQAREMTTELPSASPVLIGRARKKLTDAVRV